MAIVVSGRLTETTGIVPTGTEVKMAYYLSASLTTIAYLVTTTTAGGYYKFTVPLTTIGYGAGKKITISAGLGSNAMSGLPVYGPVVSVSRGTGGNIDISVLNLVVDLALSRYTTFSITGRVTNNLGVGVPNAKLNLIRLDPATTTNFTAVTYTDTNGYYTLGPGVNMPAALYVNGLTVSLLGYAYQIIPNISLSSNLTKNFTNFSADVHTTIAFEDNFTKTAVSALVTVVNADTGVTCGFTPETTANLAFHANIPPGNYTYVITKTNYVNNTGGFIISGDSSTYSFTASLQLNKARIYGYVVGDDSAGINGISVKISSTLGSVTQFTYTNTVSGNLGYYEILLPPGGDNTASLSKTGYSTRTIPLGILQVGNHNFNLSIGLLYSGNLVGTVLDNYNLPILNAAVTGVDLLQTSNTFSTVTNDTTGYYQVLPIEGTYSVTLSPDVYKYTPTTLINIIVPSSREIGATCSFLDVTPYVGQLAGMVVDDMGAPLHNANVYLSGLKTNSAPAIGNTITGSYLIPYLLPISGSYINATYTNHYYASYGPIELYKATTMELPALELHRYVGVVIGKVTDTLSGNNITDASLYTSFDPSNIFYNNITGQEYTYSSPSQLPIGTHTIYVTPPSPLYSGRATYQHFSFYDIHKINTVNFDILPNLYSKICGHVYVQVYAEIRTAGLDYQYERLPWKSHVQVNMQDYYEGDNALRGVFTWGLPFLTTFTDDSGYFEFTEITSNTYWPAIGSYDELTTDPFIFTPGSNRIVHVENPGDTLTVDFEVRYSHEYTLNYTIKDTNGKPVAAKITLWSHLAPLAPISFLNDNNGAQRINGIPGGTYDMLIEHSPDYGDKRFYDYTNTLVLPEISDGSPEIPLEIVMQPIIDIDKYYKVWTLTNKIDLT